jgi:hypothetical protein
MCIDPSKSSDAIHQQQMANFLDEKICSSENQIKEFYNKYLDFFKWTTSIALGALLWEGVNHQYFSNTLFFQVSLGSFFLSILSSIIFTIKILKFVNDDLELNLKHIDSLKSTIFKDINERDLFNKQQEVDRRLNKKEQNQIDIVSWVMGLVILHAVFLVGGMFFFLLGIW